MFSCMPLPMELHAAVHNCGQCLLLDFSLKATLPASNCTDKSKAHRFPQSVPPLSQCGPPAQRCGRGASRFPQTAAGSCNQALKQNLALSACEQVGGQKRPMLSSAGKELLLGRDCQSEAGRAGNAEQRGVTEAQGQQGWTGLALELSGCSLQRGRPRAHGVAQIGLRLHQLL